MADLSYTGSQHSSLGRWFFQIIDDPEELERQIKDLVDQCSQNHRDPTTGVQNLGLLSICNYTAGEGVLHDVCICPSVLQSICTLFHLYNVITPSVQCHCYFCTSLNVITTSVHHFICRMSLLHLYLTLSVHRSICTYHIAPTVRICTIMCVC